MSLSPVWRIGVTYTGVLVPLFAQVSGVPRQAVRLSSKSIVTVPLGLLIRDQNSCRNLPPGPTSEFTPNSRRSLLLGGIEPSTIVGAAVFSLVPCPNDSSPGPLAESGPAVTLSRRSASVPVSVPVLSQSMQGLAPSTLRFALASISKLLPASTLGAVQSASAGLAEKAPRPPTAAVTASDRIDARREMCRDRMCMWSSRGWVRWGRRSPVPPHCFEVGPTLRQSGARAVERSFLVQCATPLSALQAFRRFMRAFSMLPGHRYYDFSWRRRTQAAIAGRGARQSRCPSPSRAYSGGQISR